MGGMNFRDRLQKNQMSSAVRIIELTFKRPAQAYKLMCFDRTINGNKNEKILEV